MCTVYDKVRESHIFPYFVSKDGSTPNVKSFPLPVICYLLFNSLKKYFELGLDKEIGRITKTLS